MASREHRDFVVGRLGIRLYRRHCVVIEKVSAMSDWIEDGLQIRLPVSEELLSVQGPTGKFSLVVRSYEKGPSGRRAA